MAASRLQILAGTVQSTTLTSKKLSSGIAKCIISYTGHLRCYCGAHVSYVVLATPPSFRSSCLESAPV
jgi:hypothetical protein